jgi:hypothetical protein
MSSNRRRQRHVRFSLPCLDMPILSSRNNDHLPSNNIITDKDRRVLWYSKQELSVHRKDVQKTILMIRQSKEGSDLFTRQEDSQQNDDMCFHGCERYYSLESRFVMQKALVEAIVEGQGIMQDEVELRELSENLSGESCCCDCLVIPPLLLNSTYVVRLIPIRVRQRACSLARSAERVSLLRFPCSEPTSSTSTAGIA